MLTSPYLTQLPGILHGFGARHDDMAVRFPELWPVRPVQHERHGTRIAIVDRRLQDAGEADGMLTGRPGLLLAIATADCVPILLARRDGGEVAALHVGWRGAQAGIADLSASPACTMCATGADGRHVFHSYRRDRETRTPVADVQWSVIAIAASARLSARPR